MIATEMPAAMRPYSMRSRPQRVLALLERPRPPVLAFELKQIEGIEDHLAVICPAGRLSKIARPAPSHYTASPSIVADATRKPATASLMRG
jgi:hypothetical protein